MTTIPPCPFCGQAPTIYYARAICKTAGCAIADLEICLPQWSTRAPVQSESRWIPTTERLPIKEDGQFCSDGTHRVIFHDPKYRWSGSDDFSNAHQYSHWMPIPPIPTSPDPFEEWWRAELLKEPTNRTAKDYACSAWGAALKRKEGQP